MDDYDDEDLVFSGTSGAPLNAADAARRLLEETDGLVVSPETVTASSSNKNPQQAVSSSTTDIIAERLAQMRTTGGKLLRQPGTLPQQRQQPVVVRSSEIDVGYKAPLMTSTTIKKDLYADHPISAGGSTKSTTATTTTTTSSYGVSSSTHFAPVDLAPPPTMSASSYLFVTPLQQPPRTISSSMDIEEDIIDTSATPFLSSRERQNSSPSNTAASKLMAFLGQLQQLVSPLVTKCQSVMSTWLDKASTLNAQEWKKIASQGVIIVVAFIILRWVFLKLF
jgi:hypothetical protein